MLVTNFSATRCLTCLEEISHYVRRQRRLGGRGLQFVDIAIEDCDKFRTFVGKHEINFPSMVGQLAALELSEVAGNDRGGLPLRSC